MECDIMQMKWKNRKLYRNGNCLSASIPKKIEEWMDLDERDTVTWKIKDDGVLEIVKEDGD